jgi:hypothetical protein
MVDCPSVGGDDELIARATISGIAALADAFGSVDDLSAAEISKYAVEPWFQFLVDVSSLDESEWLQVARAARDRETSDPESRLDRLAVEWIANIDPDALPVVAWALAEAAMGLVADDVRNGTKQPELETPVGQSAWALLVATAALYRASWLSPAELAQACLPFEGLVAFSTTMAPRSAGRTDRLSR